MRAHLGWFADASVPDVDVIAAGIAATIDELTLRSTVCAVP
jgi:hypothetical protein